MITANMTREERIAEAKRVHRLIGNKPIAGGYIRDVWFGAAHGVVPKDIDIYVTRRGRTPEQLQVEAQEIFRRLGQELDTTVLPEDGRYGNQILVYKSTGPSEHERAEVVFYSGYRNVAEWVNGTFDIQLCEAYIRNGEIFVSHWAENCYATGLVPYPGNPDKFADHFKRVKAKYNHLKLQYNLIAYGARDYQRLVELGVINAPRQMVQAQGEVPDRNEVGLNAGEVRRGGFGRVHQERLDEAARRLAEIGNRVNPNLDWVIFNEMAVQAQPNQVPNPEVVQPGLQGGVFNWDAPVRRV